MTSISQFIQNWRGRGDEKSDTQSFWLDLLRDVYGVENPASFISFENRVKLKNVSFIDARIPSTHVLIEQKSADINLLVPKRQSDGASLTPFMQAKRYNDQLPYSQRNRWIIACNFREFHVHDMETPDAPPVVVLLENLERDAHVLNFMVDETQTEAYKETRLSIDAGVLVGRLYDALLAQYRDPNSAETLRSLNILCVRLVFCFYAEDAGILGKHNCICTYLNRRRNDLRRALQDLFSILDTKIEDRDPYLDADLLEFPYVNGGLFSEKGIEMPRMTDEIADLLISDCSHNFDWSGISPTIFGAVFESTLNPETRRSGGMHYTSIENIHRVIDPLFLETLRDELTQIIYRKQFNVRRDELRAFIEKLSALTFFDPACGSGNFLTETYLSLRQLENDALRALIGDERFFDESLSPISVSIGQFYGIEINDFAVSVARTALWIAECQMIQETEGILGRKLDFLPLKSYSNITEGNALLLDWGQIVPAGLSYVMGNPPFVGYSLQSPQQKTEILSIYTDENGVPYKTAGKIDYVAGWYFKAAQLMFGTDIRAAFVSTNSITQGEQVSAVWKPLFDRFNLRIHFAWRTFRWDSEAKIKAHVHCVIVGFQTFDPEECFLFDENGEKTAAERVNAYLMDAPNTFIESRNKPICDVPEMTTGNRPADGGHLIIEKDEYDDFIRMEPQALPFIRRLIGSEEYINNKKRWCLWLVGANPAEMRRLPKVMERINRCRQDRLSSPDAGRRKLADTPWLFRETNNPESPYIIVPRHSSENRSYIPLGFVSPEIIVNDAVQIIPNATLYHFGILTSSVHMAWMRAVCGRLEMRYRYSKDVVYNNFPWPHSPLPEGCRASDGVSEQHGTPNPASDSYTPASGHPSERGEYTPASEHSSGRDTPALARHPSERGEYPPLPFNPKLQALARENRKAGVLSEVLFWKKVHRKAFLGLDFDRQRVIGNYIVDFYVKSLRLVIEIDGKSHKTKYEYDTERQAYLEGLGLTVYRIKDIDVKQRLPLVMKRLATFIEEHYTPALARHPSERGEYTPAFGHPSGRGELEIVAAAQGILDARALYPDSSLADLYDELTMPPELRKAHRANDLAVLRAYGFSPKMSENQIVAELMKLYQQIIQR